MVAFESQQYHEAETAFKALARQRGYVADAHYMLARLYLETPLVNPPEAARALRKALQRAPNNLAYLTARLDQLRSQHAFFGPFGMRAFERLRVARRILKVDSTHALAHEEVATVLARDHEQFSSMQQRAPNEMLAKRLENMYTEIQGHFDAVLHYAPDRYTVYAPLLRFALNNGAYSWAWGGLQSMQRLFPDSVLTWRYSGLLHDRLNEPEIAHEYFERSLAMLPDEAAREDFAALHLLLTEQEAHAWALAQDQAAFAEAYWQRREPFYLSGRNERLAAHYARVTYADLFYPLWRTYSEDPWYITPGEIVVRYGLPLNRVEMMTDRNRYLTLTVPGPASFLFEDPYRSGDYVIPTTMSVEDPVTAARNVFKAVPEQPDVFRKPTFAMPFQTARFRSEDGLPMLYVTYGVPVEFRGIGHELPIAVTLGTFLTDARTGAVVDQQVQERRTLPLAQTTLVDTTRFWVETHAHTAPSGTYQVAVEADAADRLSTNRDSLTLSFYPTSRLSLSDLLLAYHVADAADAVPGALLRNAFAIQPAPLLNFDAAQPLYLYFEAYHLQQANNGRTRYSVEAVLAPAQEGEGLRAWMRRILGQDGAQEGVAVRYEDGGLARNPGTYLILDASEQAPGPYRLVVTVRDLVAGTEAQAERLLILR